jgi:uncharacterized protein YjiS (DUF1127 family)
MRQDCIDTFGTKTAPLPSWGAWINEGLRMVRADIRQLVVTPRLWHQRWHHRQQLKQISNETLIDVGLSRTQINNEAHKPFWKT